MEGKGKRVVLTIEEKYNTIQDFESGESATKLTKIHNVGKSTIADIKKQKPNIKNYIQNVDSTDASTSRKSLMNPKNKSVCKYVSNGFVNKKTKAYRYLDQCHIKSSRVQ